MPLMTLTATHTDGLVQQLKTRLTKDLAPQPGSSSRVYFVFRDKQLRSSLEEALLERQAWCPDFPEVPVNPWIPDFCTQASYISAHTEEVLPLLGSEELGLLCESYGGDPSGSAAYLLAELLVRHERPCIAEALKKAAVGNDDSQTLYGSALRLLRDMEKAGVFENAQTLPDAASQIAPFPSETVYVPLETMDAGYARDMWLRISKDATLILYGLYDLDNFALDLNRLIIESLRGELGQRLSEASLTSPAGKREQHSFHFTQECGLSELTQLKENLYKPSRGLGWSGDVHLALAHGEAALPYLTAQVAKEMRALCSVNPDREPRGVPAGTSPSPATPSSSESPLSKTPSTGDASVGILATNEFLAYETAASLEREGFTVHNAYGQAFSATGFGSLLCALMDYAAKPGVESACRCVEWAYRGKPSAKNRLCRELMRYANPTTEYLDRILSECDRVSGVPMNSVSSEEEEQPGDAGEEVAGIGCGEHSLLDLVKRIRSLCGMPFGLDLFSLWEETATLVFSRCVGTSRNQEAYETFLSRLETLCYGLDGLRVVPRDSYIPNLCGGLRLPHPRMARVDFEIIPGAQSAARRYDALVVSETSSQSMKMFVADPPIVRHLKKLGLGEPAPAFLGTRAASLKLLELARSKVCLVKQCVTERGEETQNSLFMDEVLDQYRQPGKEHDPLQDARAADCLLEAYEEDLEHNAAASRIEIVEERVSGHE